MSFLGHTSGAGLSHKQMCLFVGEWNQHSIWSGLSHILLWTSLVMAGKRKQTQDTERKEDQIASISRNASGIHQRKSSAVIRLHCHFEFSTTEILWAALTLVVMQIPRSKLNKFELWPSTQSKIHSQPEAKPLRRPSSGFLAVTYLLVYF